MTPACVASPFDPARASPSRLARLLKTLKLLLHFDAHRVDGGQTHALVFELLGVVAYLCRLHHPQTRDAGFERATRLLASTPHDDTDAAALLADLVAAGARHEWSRALVLASALERVCRLPRPRS
jgi:hypothetical protein